MTFDEYISPLTRNHFVQEHLSQSVAYFPNLPHRRMRLVTIAEVSDVISRIIVYPGMMRVKARGCEYPPSEYLSAPTTRHSAARLVKTAALEALLRSGATLFVDDCSGHFPDIDAFCRTLAEGFHSRVAATLIVTLVPDAPLPVHWDTHDVFVWQAVGSKRWPVFAPVVRYPLRPSLEGEITSPSVAWEGVMGPGDALYLPRGWPHQPVAVGTPSIHVTFDIARATGVDLLKFVVDRLVHDERVRSDLPLQGDKRDRNAFNSGLRDALLSAMSNEAVDAYYIAEKLGSEIRPLNLTAL